MGADQPADTSVLAALFAHNAWANLKLLGFCAGLSDEPTAPAWRALLLLRAPLYGGPRAPPAQIFSGP